MIPPRLTPSNHVAYPMQFSSLTIGRRIALGFCLLLVLLTRLAAQHASATAGIISERVATKVVQALNKLLKTTPVMTPELRDHVYEWLAVMPGLQGKKKELKQKLADLLLHKKARGLL